MPVDYLTLAEARADLLGRLGDPDGTFWRAAEVDGYLTEAIQTWQVAALYHRTRAGFNATPDQEFYDISANLSDGTSLVLERTLTPAQIITRIIYHLMENQGTDVDGTTWVGTEMFTLDDLTQAVYRRVNRFLEETGQIVTRATQTVPSGEGIIELASEWIDVRRVAWTTPEGVTTNLWRTSEYVADSQFNDWNVAPGTPEAYSVAVRPIRVLQLIPPPIDNGTLDILTVDSSIVTSVPVFNDFGWVVKWGAMADLLGQEGEANDPERSRYCEQRWAEGIQLAKIMSTVLRTMINGVSVQTCALFDFDAQVPDWQDSIVGATFATGSVTETVLNPIDGTALTLGGEVFVWVNVVVNPTDVLIGATIADSYQAMVAVINSVSETALCSAELVGSAIILTANAAGEPGNSITLSISDATYGVVVAFSGGVATSNAATPNTPAMAGPNLLALYPVPDVTLAVPEGNHSIVMDVVRNAIIPTADDDLVQVERQFLTTILDYAQHLASFKCQGGEFMATYHQYENMFTAAATQNSRLMEASDQFPMLATQEEKDRRRLKMVA